MDKKIEFTCAILITTPSQLIIYSYIMQIDAGKVASDVVLIAATQQYVEVATMGPSAPIDALPVLLRMGADPCAVEVEENRRISATKLKAVPGAHLMRTMYQHPEKMAVPIDKLSMFNIECFQQSIANADMNPSSFALRMLLAIQRGELVIAAGSNNQFVNQDMLDNIKQSTRKAMALP